MLAMSVCQYLHWEGAHVSIYVMYTVCSGCVCVYVLVCVLDMCMCLYMCGMGVC